MLGFNSGPDWWLVIIGFVLSAVIIPLLALFGHARLQGSMLDFGNKVSPIFSLIFCVCVYVIAVSLPIPRTAAVTHEMAIAPFFGTSSLLTSSIYFGLVFIFLLYRTQVLQIIGKYLTPLIVILLLVIIFNGLFGSEFQTNPSSFDAPLISGLLEGYQTYDALGGILIGGVLTISLNLKGYTSYEQKKKLIARSGIVAASGLFVIYAGLMALGAYYGNSFDSEINRTGLLIGLTDTILGNIGTSFLSILVALACFTTAVSVIVGTADFFKELFNDSRKAYVITGLISCILGVLVGQFDVKYIIDIALPVLMFIYPLVIVLTLLNVMPASWRSQIIFRIVVVTTFVFSIPDFLAFLLPQGNLDTIKSMLPLGDKNLAWLLPATIAFILGNLLLSKRKKQEI